MRDRLQNAFMYCVIRMPRCHPMIRGQPVIGVEQIVGSVRLSIGDATQIAHLYNGFIQVLIAPSIEHGIDLINALNKRR